jgi:hypothetical protein
MTLSIRRTLLGSLHVVAFLGTAISGISVFSWFRELFNPVHTLPEHTALWWWVLRPASGLDLLWTTSALLFISLAVLSTEFLLKRDFGRSPSPEMFFLRFFLLTLSFQTFRLCIPLASSGIIGISWMVTVTRMAWFGRFLGITALLCISVFSGDMPFRRSGYILGMGAMASMGIAVMLPLDITQPLGNLMVRTAAETPLALSCLSLEILTVLAMAGSGVSQNSRPHIVLSIYILLLVAGSDMMYFTSYPMIVPGILLVVAGIFGFVREIRNIYQWV